MLPLLFSYQFRVTLDFCRSYIKVGMRKGRGLLSVQGFGRVISVTVCSTAACRRWEGTFTYHDMTTTCHRLDSLPNTVYWRPEASFQR